MRRRCRHSVGIPTGGCDWGIAVVEVRAAVDRFSAYRCSSVEIGRVVRIRFVFHFCFTTAKYFQHKA